MSFGGHKDGVGAFFIGQAIGFDPLTALLRKLGVPSPAMQCALQVLMAEPHHKIPNVTLTPARIRELGLYRAIRIAATKPTIRSIALSVLGMSALGTHIMTAPSLPLRPQQSESGENDGPYPQPRQIGHQRKDCRPCHVAENTLTVPVETTAHCKRREQDRVQQHGENDVGQAIELPR